MLQALGPYAAALLTLIGVGITLRITGKRERDRIRLERLDARRREQREVVADLLGALVRYQREINYMVRPTLWVNGTEGEFRTAEAEINRVEADLDSLFTRTRLLVEDLPDFVEALDTCLTHFMTASATGKEVSEVFFSLDRARGRKAGQAAVADLLAASDHAVEEIDKFAERSADLHAAAIAAFTPDYAQAPTGRTWTRWLLRRSTNSPAAVTRLAPGGAAGPAA